MPQKIIFWCIPESIWLQEIIIYRYMVQVIWVQRRLAWLGHQLSQECVLLAMPCSELTCHYRSHADLEYSIFSTHIQKHTPFNHLTQYSNIPTPSWFLFLFLNFFEEIFNFKESWIEWAMGTAPKARKVQRWSNELTIGSLQIYPLGCSCFPKGTFLSRYGEFVVWAGPQWVCPWPMLCAGTKF